MKRAHASRWLFLLAAGTTPCWAQLDISINDAMLVVEGDTGTVNAVFTLDVQMPMFAKAKAPFQLNYMTRDGSATAADGDYQPATPGFVMCDDATATCDPIIVPVNGDLKVESMENFFVDLLPSPPHFLGDTEGEAMIRDDDMTAVSIGDVMLTEGGPGTTTTALFAVTLTNPSASTVTVDFATRDGSATTGDGDYVMATGKVSFAPGSVSEMVGVDVTGDDSVEPDESFFVDLTGPAGAALGDAEGEGTIANDDFPTVSIGDAAVVEGDSGTVSAVFDVTLSTPGGGPVTVDFATRDGTATTADGDYQGASGQISFAPGSTLETVTVAVNGDAVVEPDEAFFVDLGKAAGATVLDGEGEGTIENDDGATLSIDDVTVNEGDFGTVDAVFTVTLSTTAAGTVTVDFATRDGTASSAGGDYAAAAGQLSFAPGATTATIAVAVSGDGVVEPDEAFFVDLSNPDGATLADGEGVGTIQNDDGATLSIGDATVVEGTGEPTQAVFAVTLSAPSDAAVTVEFATRDGTATSAGGDYTPAGGQLVFAPGVQSRPVAIDVAGDSVVEGEETFFVDLANPSGASVADGVGQGNIVNDDGATLTIEDATVMEGDAGTADVALTVRLSAPSAAVVTVDFATGNGSATLADGDYRRASGRLSFPPGALTQSIAVRVNGDLEPEPDEVFFVDLSRPAGATLAGRRSRVTIVNDDTDETADTIRLLEPAAVSESAGSGPVTVVRSGGGLGAARVTVTSSAGSAQPGEDFRPRSRTVRWADGETGPKRFDVPLLDDNLREPDETVRVELGAPSGAVLAEPSQVELVVLDDDRPSGLEPVGDLELAAGVGEEVRLTVRVVGADGAPIACALVTWELVEGEAELLDGATVKSDDEGNAIQTVRLGPVPGTVVIRATLTPEQAAALKTEAAQPVDFTIAVEGDLGDLFDDQGSPAGDSVGEVLDEACFDATGSFGLLCDYVFGLGDEADQRTVVRELTPRETVAQGNVSIDALRAQLVNVGSRLAALRGGATRQSVDQLALDLGGKPVPVAILASAFSAERYGAGLLDRFDAAVAALDPRQEGDPGRADAGPEPAVAADAPSPWGFFLNGQASFGDSPATELEEGFDLETLGLTAGLDYRLSDRLVIGAALGYLDLEAELDGDGGGLDSQGYSLSLYTSYFRDAVYFDAIAIYGVNDFDLRRNIDLPEPFLGRTRFTAFGGPGGSQLALAAGGGYERVLGAATLGGFGRVSWIDGAVDGYDESGAGPFNLAIGGQDFESLLLEAGVEYTRAVSRPWGVLQPTLRGSLLRELEDASRLVRGRFREDPGGNEFAVPTDRPDRDYFNFGAGLTAVLVKGRSFFVFYDTDLARDDLEAYTLSLGLRLDL